MGEYTTYEEIAKLGIIDPELEKILAATPVPTEFDANDLGVRRKAMAAIEAKVLQALGPPPADVLETTVEIPMRDGYLSQCKVVQPASSSGDKRKPLIILFFGGGHSLGSNDQLIPEARAFASLFQAVAVCANYRLAPENPFPAGAKDAWDTVQYFAANAAKDFGADPSAGFIVGGVSAGASLSSVTAQLAKDNNLSPPLSGQWLSIPGFLHETTVPAKYKDLFFSREQNANAPGFNKQSRDVFIAAHKPDFSSPLYAPFNSKSGQTGLPPAYLQSCGLDPLRDDSLIYAKMLNDAGVKTRLSVYPGQPHGFWYSSPLKEKSQQVRMDIVKGIGWLLGVEVSNEEAKRPFDALYKD